MKGQVLLALVVQNSALILVMRYSRSHSDQPYLTSTAIFLAEIIKLIMSIGLRFREARNLSISSLSTEVFGPDSNALKMAIPAALYSMQNALLYRAITRLDAVTYQVTLQLKVFTTAIFAVIMLRRSLMLRQWLALFALAVGVVLVQVAGTRNPIPSSSLDEPPIANEASVAEKSLFLAYQGLLAAVAACIISGFSSIFFEKVLKETKASMWVRNIQLAVFGSIFTGVVGVLWTDGDAIARQGFWSGYDAAAFATVFLNATTGIIVALVLKYADNILKGFASGMSIVLSSVISALFLGYAFKVESLVGIIMVVYAIRLYTKESNRSGHLKREADSVDKTETLLPTRGDIASQHYEPTNAYRWLWRLTKKLWPIVAVMFAFLILLRSNSTVLKSLRQDPVYQDQERIIPQNTPISRFRPSSQYWTPHHLASPKPILTLLTCTYNPGEVTVTETAAMVRNMSLQNYRWILVNDHSDDHASVLRLDQIAASDPRISVRNSTNEQGRASCRNFGMKLVKTKYFAFLDDDDMCELTVHEKAIWLLESAPHLAFASWAVIMFTPTQGRRHQVGAHLSHLMYGGPGNMLHSGTLVRFSAAANADCFFQDPFFNGGGEDWEFWLCLANAGYWGADVADEFSYWYRRAPNWESFHGGEYPFVVNNGVEYLYAKYAGLKTKPWPSGEIGESGDFELIHWRQPFENTLLPSKRRMLVLVDSLLGGTTSRRRILELVNGLSRRGWRVTVVSMQKEGSEVTNLRPNYLAITHDVFVLPSFLRVADFPRFIAYLTKSRGIKYAVIAGSEFSYQLLPALVENLPDVHFMDYVQGEPMREHYDFEYSAVVSRYLSATIAATPSLANHLISSGRRPAIITAAPVSGLAFGVSPNVPKHSHRSTYRVLAATWGMSHQLQFLDILTIAATLPGHIVTVLPCMKNMTVWLYGEIQRRGLAEGVVVHEIQHDTVGISEIENLFTNSDVVLIPFKPWATTSAIMSMSAGIPFVVSRGILPMQIIGKGTETAGVEADSNHLNSAVAHLIADGVSRNRLRSAGLRRSSDLMYETLLDALSKSQKAVVPASVGSNSAAYFAIRNILEHHRDTVDASHIQRNLPKEYRSG
ncbi:hypothetical protein HK104_002027 [Borealophlyctis nickersoniae]|nr:hypothetical protein HK104_002027 [Borealophlyctis nickersoniae]